MDLDGPVFVYEWANALHATEESFVQREDLRVVVEVPYGSGCDHAEGMTLADAKPSIMLCYDSPAPDRIDGDNAVRSDVFAPG
jgi:hypothetical protein